MTTTQTISRERLEGIQRGEKCYTHDDITTMASMLLAALDSEPVVWASSEALDSRLAGIEAVTIPFVPGMDIPLFRHQVITHNGDCDTDPFGFARRSGDLVVIDVNGDPHVKDGMPLYAAPPAQIDDIASWSNGKYPPCNEPAPVAVPDEKTSRELFEAWCTANLERNKWHPEIYAYLPAREQWAAWNACRAAMQAEPVTVPDGWKLVPLELLESLRDAAHFEKTSYAASFGSHIDTGRWKDEFEELESVCKAVDKILAAPEQEV